MDGTRAATITFTKVAPEPPDTERENARLARLVIAIAPRALTRARQLDEVGIPPNDPARLLPVSIVQMREAWELRVESICGLRLVAVLPTQQYAGNPALLSGWPQRSVTDDRPATP